MLKIKTILFLSLIGLISCSGGGGGDSKLTGSGESCTSSAGCIDGEYCKFSDFSCGALGAAGRCYSIPVIDCNDPANNTEQTIIGPVCSCERLTFKSECWADAAGQSISGAGECA